jgi:membrane protease YdiL (CAAX protease family)
MAVGTGVWYGIGVAMGWTAVELAWTYEGGPVGLWVGLMVLVWGTSGVYQATLYFGLWLTNAAEGLATRGLSTRQAVVGAWAVTAVLFVLRHTPGDLGEVGVLLAGGTVFGAMYVHSGELALPIGAIGLGNFVNLVLFVPHDQELAAPVVFEVTQSLPAGLAPLADPRLPQMVIGYLVVAAWLQWRRDGLSIDASITRWTPR